MLKEFASRATVLRVMHIRVGNKQTSKHQKSSSSELGYRACQPLTARNHPQGNHSQSSARTPSCRWVDIIDVGLGVVRHPLLEKVGFALQRNHVHKVKGILGIIHLGVAERYQQAIGNELDVSTHELSVHADQSHWQSVLERS